MTDTADAALIAASLESAAMRGGDLTADVYARLFVRQPELEALFAMDTNGAVRGEMLARTFDAILDFIGARHYAHTLIRAEAANHESYAVPRQAFASFFAVVEESVRHACGPAWTPATAAAWTRLRAELSGFIAA